MGGMWEWPGHGGPVAVFALTVFFALSFFGVVLWLAVPIAVLRARSALREIAEAQRETNRILADLRALQLRDSARPATPEAAALSAPAPGKPEPSSTPGDDETR